MLLHARIINQLHLDCFKNQAATELTLVTGFMKTDHFAKNTKIELFISEDSSIYGDNSKCGSVAIGIPSQRYNAKRERYFLLSIVIKKKQFASKKLTSVYSLEVFRARNFEFNVTTRRSPTVRNCYKSVRQSSEDLRDLEALLRRCYIASELCDGLLWQRRQGF